MGYKRIKNEIKELIKENFSFKTNKELMEEFNISLSTISRVAFEYNLKKDENFKIKTREVYKTDEDIYNLSLKFNTFAKFRSTHPKVYNRRVRNNQILLEKIKSNFIQMNYSTPQLIIKDIMDYLLKIKSSYNNRMIIKPYEIDIYYKDFKLGFEYNSKNFHENNENDNLKLNKCKELGIELIIIKENDRKYEYDIKKQLIYNLQIINNKTNSNITEDDILNFKINLENYIPNIKNLDICFEYDDLNKFKKEHKYLTSLIYRNKLSDKYFKHMYKKKNFRKTYTEIEKEALGCKSYKEFIENKGLYLMVYKYFPDLFKEMSKIKYHNKYGYEQVKEELYKLNFKTYKDFVSNDNIYRLILHKFPNLLEEMRKLPKK